MKRLAIYFASGFAALLVICGVWFLHLLWHSPNYEAQGTCTASEIARAEVEIQRWPGFGAAANLRANRESWTLRPHVPTLESTLERTANAMVYDAFGKRKTAAFFCNNAQRHVDGQAATSMPQIAALLKPYEADESVRWRMATYMTFKPYNIAGASSYEMVKQKLDRQPQR